MMGEMTKYLFENWFVTDEAHEMMCRSGDFIAGKGFNRKDALKTRRDEAGLLSDFIASAMCDSDCNFFYGEETPIVYEQIKTDEHGSVENYRFGQFKGDDAPWKSKLPEDSNRDAVVAWGCFKEWLRLWERSAHGNDDFLCAMLHIRSLSICGKIDRKEQKVYILCASRNGKDVFLPFTYRKATEAEAEIERLASQIIPRNWHRCQIVIKGKEAKISCIDKPDYDHDGEYADFTLAVRKLSIPALSGASPFEGPHVPVLNWNIVRTKDESGLDISGGEWIDHIMPRQGGADVADSFAAKCDWWKIDYNSLGPREWMAVLRYRPDMEARCNCWEEFDPFCWQLILRRQPEFYLKFRDLYLPRLDENEKTWFWSVVLNRQPSLADFCDCWERFEDYQWITILKGQPQFANRFNGWDRLDSGLWTELLERQPQFSVRCEKWSEFCGSDWCKLLLKQPQFAKRCNDWSVFSSRDWCELLRDQPRFGEKCNWKEFDWELALKQDWKELIDARPEFIAMAGIDCPIWKKFTASNWIELIKTHPELVSICEGVYKWRDDDELEVFVKLINLAPGLSRNCDLEKWEGHELEKILIETNVNWQSFPCEKLLAWNWVSILEKKPAYANKCKWEILSEDQWFEIIMRHSEVASFMPKGIITSLRLWRRLARRHGALVERLATEVDLAALSGREIVDLLIDVPTLSDRVECRKITDDLDKARLRTLRPELAGKLGFGDSPICNDVEEWNSVWEGASGKVLHIGVKGDIFDLPENVKHCDAAVVLEIKNRSKQIRQSYEKWEKSGEEQMRVVRKVVSGSRVDPYDEDYGDVYYVVYESELTKALDQAFGELAAVGVKTIAINGIDPAKERFTKVVERWFQEHASPIRTVYLVDLEGGFSK